jgi:small subunit ribosomal protein S5
MTENETNQQPQNVTTPVTATHTNQASTPNDRSQSFGTRPDFNRNAPMRRNFRDGNRGGQPSTPGGPNNAPGGPGNNRNRFDRRRPNGGRSNNRQKDDANALETQIILVRRITRVVKGGKRMRFSALVVSGDRAGKIGFGLKKGLDFQDAVAKATKKAQDSAIKIKLNDNGSIDFPIQEKYKSCEIMLKPAKSGTGVIAGGFLRPVLELAGVKNIYTKIIGSRNKIAGVQTTLKTLQKFEGK